MLLGCVPTVLEVQLGWCVQSLIARGPNHSDNAGPLCWIQPGAGNGLREHPVDENR